MERIGFHVRVGASLVDLFILAVLVHLAMAVDLVLNRPYDVIPFGTITWGVTGGAVLLAVALESLSGAGVGKRVLGLAIGDEGGGPAPRSARMKRASMKFAPMILAFLPVAAFAPVFDSTNGYGLRAVQLDGLRVLGWVDLVIWAGVSALVVTGCFRVLKPPRQAFHDRFAGTAVYLRRELLDGRGFVPFARRADPPALTPAPATGAAPSEPPAGSFPPRDSASPAQGA